MRLFLVLALLALTTSPAQAQERIPGTSPDKLRAATTRTNPVISAATPGCVLPDTPFFLRGYGLDEAVPGIVPKAEFIPLDILSRTEAGMTVRLPQDFPAESRTDYPLALLPGDGKPYVRSGPALRLCDTLPTATGIHGRDTEILILAPVHMEQDVLKALETRSLPVVRKSRLAAFGDTLVLANGNQDDLARLRRALPNADIDLNGHFAPAGAPRLYAAEKINWPAISPCRAAATDVSLGLIDGAIDASHPALKDTRIQARDFTEGAKPDLDHATAIASILNGKDGLLPGAEIYDAVVLGAEGETTSASTEGMTRALDWLLGRDVRLINISLAGPAPDRVLGRAVSKTLAKGAVIFAAAGNMGPDAPPQWPAALDGVIAVTATDAADRIYTAANRGAYIDFAAPGVDVWTAAPGKPGLYRSGTSYAAPHAMAVAAALLSRNKAMPRDVLVRALRENAHDLGAPGQDNTFGYGMVLASCGSGKP